MSDQINHGAGNDRVTGGSNFAQLDDFIDPRRAELERAVIDGAIEVRGNPSEGSMPWLRFHHAVDQLLASRNPEPAPRCEPPAHHRNFPWHWITLKFGQIVCYHWMPTGPGGEWSVPGYARTFTPEDFDQFGHVYHSLARPMGGLDDDELIPASLTDAPEGIAKLDEWAQECRFHETCGRTNARR